MKNRYSRFKKGISGAARTLLAAALAVSMTPIQVFADETTLSKGRDGVVADQNVSKEDDSMQKAAEAKGPLTVDYHVTKDDLVQALVGGKAAKSKAAAVAALKSLDGVSEKSARSAAAILMDAASDDAAGETNKTSGLPKSADGSDIDSITIEWVTPDTIDNDDASLLYIKPQSDEDVNAQFRVTASLSGENDYEAGSIEIIIPGSIFSSREGAVADSLRLSVPAAPSTSSAWNYSVNADGDYVITNTRTIAAATQAFFDFQWTAVTPHEIVDMALTKPLSASIEVTTHLGNLIGASSDAIYAQVDTESEISGATKRLVPNNEPTMYTREEVESMFGSVPEQYLTNSEGQDERGYVVVRYYMNPVANTSNNQPFTVDMVDKRTDTDKYKGWIVKATSNTGSQVQVSDDGNSATSTTLTDYYTTAASQKSLSSKYAYVTVAYPLSQFTSGEEYTFTNRVDYTLTEIDPENGDDPQKVTTASSEASVPWKYEEPVFVNPDGTFWVDKRGVDADFRNAYNSNWGYYPEGLNTLRENNDQTINYWVREIASLMPWTLGEGKDPKLLENYGQREVTITDTEQGLTINGTKLAEGSDFDYSAYTFVQPTVNKATAVNLDEYGNLTTLRDGTYTYATSADAADIPIITLQVQRGGSEEWIDWARADWTSGSLVITPLADGASVEGSAVMFTEDVDNFRTTYTSNFAGRITTHGYVSTTLHPNSNILTTVEEAFDASYSPLVNVVNTTGMTAEREGASLYEAQVRGTDKLAGYTTDTRAELVKAVSQTGEDYDLGFITLHYESTLDTKSFINNRETYQSALDNGDLAMPSGGTWYDLLPVGVAPDMDSIAITGGSIVSTSTIPNYKGSGRTLLVVKVDYESNSVSYRDGDVSYWAEEHELSFDAIRSFDSIRDYGKTSHNVIAFESYEDVLGTVEGYRGEDDDPNAGNHYNTKAAWSNDDDEKALEVAAMTDLDPDRDSPNVLYAGVAVEADYLVRAESGINKKVMVNNDGIWSDGTYYGEREKKARDVYEGGFYSYFISMTSNPTTETSNIVFYDSLENYQAKDGNDAVDIDAPRWQGTFNGLGVSSLEGAGIKPVVYYSANENLQLSSSEVGDKTEPLEENVNLANSDVWMTESDWFESGRTLADVKAFAVDCKVAEDGSAYVLQPTESISFTVNMLAPQGEEAEKYINEDAHAYNNAYAAATNTQVGTTSSVDNFVRKDYVKVGLSEYKITVNKRWNDDNDRDGVRTDSVTVHLYADGEDTGRTIVLNDGNSWEDTFRWLPYFHDDGTTIAYSVVEDVPDGYSASIAKGGDSGLIVTNTHEPEKTSISGLKSWVEDNENVRPEYIRVSVYADDSPTPAATQTVRPDEVTGEWSYEFTNLLKYRDHGQEIQYSIKEDRTGLASYITSYEGNDIINTYHPYGDLQFSKSLVNATGTASEKEFSFIFTLTKDGEPVDGAFDYVVVDSEGNEVGTGTVETGGSIKVKGDQTVTIKELPEYADYALSEEPIAGFTQTNAANDEGSIKPNDTVSASFTNTYASNGSANVQATKVLTGKSLSRGNFQFRLTDASGNLVSVASNNRPSGEAERITDEDDPRYGNLTSSSSVSFSRINFDQDDDGQTFVYTLSEVNQGRTGYAYDDSVYTVEMTPRDNGDGTMDVDVVYKDASGNVVQAAEVVFDNTYEAHGSFTPVAYKDLKGGELAEGQFTFEVGRLTTNGEGKTVFDSLGTAVNAADDNGTITFDELEYDQTDIGNTYTYAIREVAGSDTTLDYDEHYYVFSVEVSDFGTGTLSLNVDFDVSVDCFVCDGDGVLEESADCEDCGGEGVLDDESACSTCGGDGKVDAVCDICGGDGVISNSSDSDTFVNSYHTGGLDIQKTTDGSGDPNQKFKFRVELSNEEGEPVEIDMDDMEVEELAAAGEGEGESANPLSAAADAALGVLDILMGTEKAYGAETQYSGTYTDDGSNLTWVIDTDGVLTLSGNLNVPSNKSIWMPWNIYRSSIKKVVFENGTTLSGRMENLFYGCSNLTEVDFTGVNTSGVTSMRGLFYNCSSLTSANVELLDTSNVTDMSQMFDSCRKLTSLDVSGWGTSNVTDMASIFYGCSGLTSLDVSDWDTSNVTNMTSTFSYCTGLTELDVSGWDTSNVTNMSQMFNNCTGLTSLDVSDWDTSNVTNMMSTFNYCTGLTSLDISDWDTSSATNMMYMFNNCRSLTNIDVTNWDTSSVTNMSYMFRSCTGLTSMDVSGLDTSNVTNMASMFAACTGLTSMDVSGLDTSNVTNMAYMFDGCTGLTSIPDFSSCDTSNVTSIECMFRGCTSLTDATFSGVGMPNLTTMTGLFSGCTNLQNADFSGFELGKVASLRNLFSSCTNLVSVDFSDLDTSNVTTMAGMFTNCQSLNTVDLSNFDSSKVTDMSGMFYGCRGLTNLDVSGLDTSSVTNMRTMFYGCSGLTELDVSSWDTSKVTNMSYMFYGCRGLTELDISTWDTSRATDMSGMFMSCTSLADLDVSAWDTSSLIDMYSMFNGCVALTELDVSGWNTSSATNMSSTFSGCTGLTDLDVSSWDTSSASTMSYMFSNCRSLSALDVSSWNTSKVSDMSSMFSNCPSISELDVSAWDTSSVTNMTSMFRECAGLTELDASGWDTSNVTNMRTMFYSCRGLTKLDVSGWDTSKVTDMDSMFRYSTGLTELDITSWNTSKVTDMDYMFGGATGLISIDLSNFSTRGAGTTNNNTDYILSPNIRELTVGEDALMKSYMYAENRSYTSGLDSNKTWVLKDELLNPDHTKWRTGELVHYIYTSDGSAAGTYVWDTTMYLSFDKNADSATGLMGSVYMDYLSDYELPKTGFKRKGYAFAGWNTKADGTGDTYANTASIPAGTFSGDATLYAMWEKAGNAVQVEEGVYEVEIRAGEVLHFSDDLPSGTTYKVYELTPAGWSLVSSSGTSGKIEADKTATAAFSNEYTPGKTTATISASKTLDGVAADGFSFTLSENGEVLQTVASSNGAVTFETLTYGLDDVGVHTYTIAEVVGTDGTVNYDGHTETVTVEVTDDGEGNLAAQTTYVDAEGDTSSGRASFANTTKPGNLSIAKTASGAQGDISANQEFSFTVTVAGKPYQGTYTVGDDTRTTDDGKIALKAGETALIADLAAGSSYTVVEDGLAGWTQVDASQATGSIVADQTASVNFANEYAASGSIALEATKMLSGSTLVEGQFSFQLVDRNGENASAENPTVLQTAANSAPDLDGVGTVLFENIEFSDSGTYTYGVREVVPEGATDNGDGTCTLNGVVYNPAEQKVVVEVTDQGNGKLSAKVKADDSDSLAFMNRMTSHKLTISKAVANENLDASVHDEEFAVKLELKTAQGDAATAKLGNSSIEDGDTVKLKAGETIELTEVPYGATYRFTEVNIPAGWQVVDPTAITGVVSDDSTAVTFTNMYDASGSVVISTSKTLDGKTPEADAFTFSLLDSDGSTRLATATNAADGTVTFNKIDYGLADVGKHVYYITEVEGTDPGIAYDAKTVKATVTVADAGKGKLATSVKYKVVSSAVEDAAANNDGTTEVDEGDAQEKPFENLTTVQLARTGGAGVGLLGLMILLAGVVWKRRRRKMEA